jgi:MFS family permease
MGSLALMPLGYAIAGPLAATFGARTVLGIGSAIGLVLLALGLAPHQTRALRDGANAASTEQFAHAIAVEASTDA